MINICHGASVTSTPSVAPQTAQPRAGLPIDRWEIAFTEGFWWILNGICIRIYIYIYIYIEHTSHINIWVVYGTDILNLYIYIHMYLLVSPSVCMHVFMISLGFSGLNFEHLGSIGHNIILVFTLNHLFGVNTWVKIQDLGSPVPGPPGFQGPQHGRSRPSTIASAKVGLQVDGSEREGELKAETRNGIMKCDEMCATMAVKNLGLLVNWNQKPWMVRLHVPKKSRSGIGKKLNVKWNKP